MSAADEEESLAGGAGGRVSRGWDMNALARILWGEESTSSAGNRGAKGGTGASVGVDGRCAGEAGGRSEAGHPSPGRRPPVEADTGEGGFISPDARLAGDIGTGRGACIYPGVHVRAGEGGRVTLEDMCVILDGAAVLAPPGTECVVGEGATVSQGAVLMGCRLGAGCLVGRDAVVLEGCVLADGSVVHDRAVLPPGTVTEEAVLVRGYPPSVVRPVEADEVRRVVEANRRLRTGCREYSLHAAMKRL